MTAVCYGVRDGRGVADIAGDGDGGATFVGHLADGLVGPSAADVGAYHVGAFAGEQQR